VAFDAESRLVVGVVPGERTVEDVVAAVGDFQRRTEGRLMDLITTDGYSAYEGAILNAYGDTISPPRTGKRGRPKAAYKVAPQGLIDAMVEKTREKGRAVKVVTRVVYGTLAAVMTALGMSGARPVAPDRPRYGSDDADDRRCASSVYRPDSYGRGHQEKSVSAGQR
jgi:hypothetical protein